MKKHSHIWKILIFDMFIIEFGPVGVFFVAYHFSNFSIAALALAISTGLALLLSQVVNKRVPWFAVFSGLITIATATATYLYDSPTLLIVMDTVYYVLFSLLLFVGILRKKSVFKTFFGHVFAITTLGWQQLERRWFVFFLLAALSNEMVRINLTAGEWVIYKQIVVLVFVAFGLYQFRVSIRHRLPEADRLGLRKHTPVEVSS